MIEPGADARPDHDALDPASRSMLRALLLCELIEQIDAAAATSSPDPAATTERKRVSALDAMLEIRRALDRLDDGTYGTCERCSVQITLSELQHDPTGRLCRLCSPRPRSTRRFAWNRVSTRTWSAASRARKGP